MNHSNNSNEKLNSVLNILYWCLPFILIIPQILFSLKSTNQVRYEELNESVRNVLWLKNHLVYDGGASNVGWYSIVLTLNNLFGFSLFTGKIFRVLLQFVSIFALAALLSKFIKKSIAWIPLATLALSPSTIYLNTILHEYGLDLQYLPICLYLVFTIPFKKSLISYSLQITLWSLTMFAWLSYPTFIFYIPIIGFMYIFRLKKEVHIIKDIIVNILISLTSFLTPLIIASFYISNRSLLLYDSTIKTGIFRGGGVFSLNNNYFLTNLYGIISDLFIQGKSYYFELPQPEFSLLFPIITVILSIVLGLLIIKDKKLRIPAILCFVLIIVVLTINGFTSDPSGLYGMRRNTPLFVGIYGLFLISWYVISQKKWKNKFLQSAFFIIFMFPLIHNIVVFPTNYASLKNNSRYKYLIGGEEKLSPQLSLDKLVNQAKSHNIYIECQNGPCRPILLASLIMANCGWNKLNCFPLFGKNKQTNKFIIINVTNAKLLED